MKASRKSATVVESAPNLTHQENKMKSYMKHCNLSMHILQTTILTLTIKSKHRYIPCHSRSHKFYPYSQLIKPALKNEHKQHL